MARKQPEDQKIWAVAVPFQNLVAVLIKSLKLLDLIKKAVHAILWVACNAKIQQNIPLDSSDIPGQVCGRFFIVL